nr:prepilin peptidase [Chloroflexota bacterium]
MQLISVVARSEHVVEIGNWPAWYAAVVAAFVLLIGALAVLDARTHRIPNRIVYPALAAGAIHAFVQPIGPWWSFVAAGVIAGLLLIAIGVASG